MNKKWKYEEVKELFERNGFVLLEKEYINSKVKMKYICECGNKTTIRFKDFKLGCRCQKCFAVPLRYTQETVINIFNSKGYKLLDIYIHNKQKLKYECKNGHVTTIKLNALLSGCGCRKCTSLEKLTQEYVKNYFTERGCELLDIYINNHTPMKYRCVCENISFINFNNFQYGHRCMNCYSKKRSGEGSFNWNQDRKVVKLNRRITKLCCGLLHGTLRRINDNEKTTKTHATNGFTKTQLLEHLQKDPHFEDWKNDSYNWHIDHIFPIKAFVDNGVTDPKIINSLDNLRIISARENFSKNRKYNKNELLNYLSMKGINGIRK